MCDKRKYWVEQCRNIATHAGVNRANIGAKHIGANMLRYKTYGTGPKYFQSELHASTGVDLS
jgi:hypothetical protein